ncbi:MAG: hypothetical protein H6943_00555 [Zoogloeaceae bacterium]|nr:hypothetical protein [Zoogloeaceae bacterium]
MQARKLTARQGWGWLAAGLAIFLKNPPMLTLTILGYWLIIAVVNAVPLLGPVIVTMSIPAFSVSLMNAARNLDSGRTLDIQILFSGFRSQLKTLIMLGGLYLVTSLLALGASAIADGGMFLQMMIGGYRPSPEELAEGSMLLAAQIALILMAPVIMAWWYAPVLVAWHGFSAGKALFFSLMACLRNWKPFLAYGICIMTFGGLLPGLVLGLLVSAIPEAASVATTLFTLPLVFVLAPTLIASFYVSYREVFSLADDEETRPLDA